MRPLSDTSRPLENEDRLPTRFAFSGELNDVLREYFWRDADNAVLSAKFKLYYRLRPYIPIWLRQILQRERNQGIEQPEKWYLPREFVQDFSQAISRELRRGSLTHVIHPWPSPYAMSAVLTHDVETKDGVELVDKLARVEESHGLRSAWNFIPYKYKIDAGLLNDLKSRGHEIGVHGYNHDGRLFESRRTFDSRIAPINRAIIKYGSQGFRAPMVHRNLQWLQSLEIDYDASCFDIDPFQAMPGGVGGVWPFIAGKFVELPYTLPQDHTLLVSLGETTADIWIEKFAYLKSMSGMAMLVTHPDYLDTSDRLNVYRSFLEYLQSQTDCWNALPMEVATWWRARDQMEIVADNGSHRIQGPSSDRALLVPLSGLLSC